MGISELLKILKPIITEKHLSELKGKTAAVDMMAWIYRGVYASAVDIGQGKDSTIYLNFPLKMLALLHTYEIECIAVFDGNNIKAKENVEEIRNENKEKNLELAQKLLSEGKEEESKKNFRRALKIKSKMINTLIEILKKLGVRIIVAPYEADAQIAFLCKNGLADFAITEDSDLIPFGVNKIAFKLHNTGYFSYLDMDSFRNSNIEKIDDPCLRFLRKISINHLRLVEFCVMLGCDYLPSIKGYGIKTGVNLYETYEKAETVLHRMKFIDKFKKIIPEGYLDKFKKCVALFFLQTVYNPIENKLQSLNDLYIETISDKEKNTNETLRKYSKLCMESENFLGDMNIENFKYFCNGEIDVKTFKHEKKLESNEIIQKYVNKFRSNFKVKDSMNKNVKKVEEIKNETYDELNYDISHMHENNDANINQDHNYDRSELVKNTFIQNDDLKETQFNSSNQIINLDKNIIDDYELEMQYCINESLKTEKKKKHIKRISLERLVDSELVEMMKIKESLKAEDKIDIYDNGIISSLIYGEQSHDKLTNTPDKQKISDSINKNIITPDLKEKSSTNKIKSLFDILENEKEMNFHLNRSNIESPLKSILSPNLKRLSSPYVEKSKNLNFMFNSGNKPIVKAQESLNVKDRVKSPSQCVLTFSKSNESFNHRDHPIIAAKTNNFNHGNNNNKFEIKSPNKMDLNPNMFQKRKHSELTYTKALNFDKDTISGLEHKNPTINMGSFMLKNNLK